MKWLIALLLACAPVPAFAQQGNWVNGVYTLAAGPDNVYTNLPPAAYPFQITWVSDRPGGPGFMVSDGTAWISDQGPAGANGKSVLNGAGAPSSGIGTDGDFYVDTTVYRIYGPKSSGAWGSGASLIGATGPAGTNGTNGAPGSAATVSVGTVTTLSPGTSATVTNSGSSSAATFNFGIPAGTAGTNGAPGAAATIAVGTVASLAPGATPTVTNAGTSGAAVFNFGIPQGVAGAAGAAGATGATGSPGSAATVSIGSVTALAPGSTPTVTNVGTSGAAILNFGLTTGNPGADGAPGANSFGSPTSRTLSLATAYQATTIAKPAVVTVNLSSTASLSLTGGTSNTADVVIGSTNAVASGTGTLICRYANTNTGALTVGLALSTTAASTCTFALPTGWFFAVRQTAGSVTITSAFDQVVG